MSYSKEFIEALLAAGDEYTEDKILDFKKLPRGIPTTEYVDFIYKNVSSPKNPFRIEPFELFLLTNDEPNAFAFKKDGFYIIGIHLSLYKLLETKIREKIPTFKDPALSIISAVGKCSPYTVDFLMYQFITLFTYYHELAHLHQLKHADDLGIACFEKYHLIEGKEFDQIAHAMEIDADLFAANQVTFHILQYWADFTHENKTKENLESFISMVAASFFLFFFELAGGWQDLYFLDYDHPHPLIRTAYISDAIANIASLAQHEELPKPDMNKCISNALVIAQQLLSNGKQDGLGQFVKQYMNHIDKIGEYVKEMGAFNTTVDFLIVNWYKE